MKYYDITFHEVSGRAVIKRGVPSEQAPFDAWQDACVKVTPEQLFLMVNETNVILERKFITRTDVEEVADPIDTNQKRKDEFTTIVNTLSNMGF
ncbi:hypothetical protein JZO76_02335 [Enterococcus sp. MJM12]|uniref:Phage protein n=1 Tax=Candidatus Enterococcus myersii TaxID=2815322 RepID=A0ABS3H5V0_9ENTE|nr:MULTISPECIES: hypothetical protein [unclassified Enterococcus]MBO0448364.1 hypothetical protein [Enterococcus sp. MJM12]